MPFLVNQPPNQEADQNLPREKQNLDQNQLQPRIEIFISLNLKDAVLAVKLNNHGNK